MLLPSLSLPPPSLSPSLSPSHFCPQIPAFVIYGLTCVLGVFNHYIVPHVRKEMPWLLFSEPIVKPREWDAYEVSGTVV